MLKADTQPLIMPYPRTMKTGKGAVNLRAVTLQADGKVAKRAAKVLAAGLKQMGLAVGEGGYQVSLVQAQPKGRNAGDEWYSLQVSQKGAALSAGAYAGLYYAVQSLLQLVALKEAGTKRPAGKTPARTASLPLVEITDWPLKPIRGGHTYLPARENLPFFKRFIEWMGRHKLNTMFLEIGGGMEYKRHPEVNQAWVDFCKEAMEYPGGPDALQDSQWFFKNSTHTELAGGGVLSQAEVKKIARWCADNAIEIMPEVQSLSHSYYMVIPHPEIAEMKDDPWPDNYCPSNPKSYELFFDILDEVIEVLNPRLIHIGHDEAYLFGHCPKCKKRDAAEIYATDITKARDYLAERGIRTAIWGDKLLEIHHPNGVTYGGVERNIVRYGKNFHLPATNRCVDLIPKDVLIFDWYWSLSYESASMLAAKGYEMIYGNFHGPSFKGWAEYRQNPSLLGGETSLWCEVDNYSIGRNGTFHNILWGANDLWSDVDPDTERERIVSDIAATMRKDRLRLGPTPSVLQAAVKKRMKPVDMTRSSARGMYPGDTPGSDLSALPRGLQVLGGVEFSIPGDGETPATVPVVDWHVRSCPPIPISGKADAIAFLHTTTVDRVHAPTYYSLNLGPNTVGAYLVTYDDGKTVEVPLEYGWNIDAFGCRFMVGQAGDQSATLGAYAYAADPVLTGEAREGEPFSLFMYEWVNPRPDSAIRDVRLTWQAGYQKGIIALIAMTVVRQG